MIEKPLLSKQRIIDCLKINYGIDVATLTFLPLGADMQASIYKAQTHDPLSYFVKLKQGHHPDISANIIAVLSNTGIQHIIPIVKTIQGQPTQRIDDFTLTVSPFIEGHDGFIRDLTDDQWYSLGKVIRQIHEIDVPASIRPMLRRESYSPKWRQAVQSLYPLIESKPSGDTIAANLLMFIKKHTAEIHRLVDRAEQLSQKIQNQSPECVLCHGASPAWSRAEARPRCSRGKISAISAWPVAHSPPTPKPVSARKATRLHKPHDRPQRPVPIE
ncbi:MAG TPA: hypothetical protein PLV25_07815 [Opitutales bacterium]|nr:hypothetical protein [Opitutales bacterium]